jgi:hypothetical protein
MSRFVYTPADQTDLKESFKRYKEIVRNESDRKIHSAKQQITSPDPSGRDVLGQQEQSVFGLRVAVITKTTKS